jgi:hypothetical protein
MQPITDTSPEIAEIVRARLMALTSAERFRIGVAMFEAARRMVLASLPADLTETERKRRLFERLYGEALPAQAGIRSENPWRRAQIRRRTRHRRGRRAEEGDGGQVEGVRDRCQPIAFPRQSYGLTLDSFPIFGLRRATPKGKGRGVIRGGDEGPQRKGLAWRRAAGHCLHRPRGKSRGPR